jgi:uncharacterized protein (UPF0303 family)
MTIESDLAKIVRQEERLQFASFSPTVAWALGLKLQAAAAARNAPVAIDISLATRQLFFAALEGSAPDNAEWIRRKRNCVYRFARSSYRVKLDLDLKGVDLAARSGTDPRDFAASGGSFPVALKNTGIIGAITVSGLPQREDHSLIVDVLANILGEDAKALALD